MKYDKDKVSPRPWIFDPGDEMYAPCIRDGDGRLVFELDSLCHAVHCVNSHDALVEALEGDDEVSEPGLITCLEWALEKLYRAWGMAGWKDGHPDYDNAQDRLYRSRETLAAAKTEPSFSGEKETSK